MSPQPVRMSDGFTAQLREVLEPLTPKKLGKAFVVSQGNFFILF